MKKRQRRFLAILLLLLLLAGSALMVRQVIQYRAAAKTREQAQQLVQDAIQTHQENLTAPTTEPPAQETQPTVAPEVAVQAAQQAPLEESAGFLLDMDYTSMQDVNPDVIGWIHIPDTDISFPLLRSYDNEDYLYHAWDGSYSGSGSIFLECKNNKNLLDFNTIIYGHHMRNGTVFASLMDYEDQSYRDEHPYIYIVTDNDLRRYEIFSAYEAGITSDTYRLYLPDDAAKQAALDHFINSSVLERGLIPTISDHILTLSTCTGTGIYDTRWVVQACLTGIWVR